MVIQQIRGEWECHAENLRGYMEKCRSLITEIRSLIRPDGEILIEHVLRELNKEADALSNLGMDQVQPASYSR
jgi:ribonuclease HI